MDLSIIETTKRNYRIVGNNEKLNCAIDRALQVAPTDLPVLVIGESGVGKEIIPRIIHDKSRRRGRYIAINCGAIPESTIESELFGHEKGSFTSAISDSEGYFGAANGGTIFLDEVAELPKSTQARLLRVLETGEYIRVGSHTISKTDVRIVAATNVNLQQAIREGRFREDLYYRLAGVPIYMPSLRERGDDIERLFRSFALTMANKYRQEKPVTLTYDAKQLLLNYKWPGNVRQLKRVAEQLAVLSTERVIDAEVLGKCISDDGESTALTVIKNSGDHAGTNERELLWKVILDMKNNLNEMKAEMKQLRLQRDDQRGLAGARGFDTPAEETIAAIPTLTSEPAGIMPAQTSHDFLEAEEIHDAQQAPPTLREINEKALLEVLKKNNGNREKTARDLGISQRTLYRRLDELGISKKKK